MTALLVSLLRRLLGVLATMTAVSLLVFLALETDRDGVAAKVLGQFSTQDQRQAWLLAHGYFDPLPWRYLRWAASFLTGRWGVSTYYQAEVLQLLPPRLLASGVLMASTLLVTAPLSILLGVLSGVRAGSRLDRAISIGAVVTTSIPEYASAVFLTALFVVGLGWLPGVSTLADGVRLKELILPVAVLSLASMGYLARMTRASMIETMASPYVRTAFLKGASPWRIVLRHALRNALGPSVTVLMLQLPWLLSGAIVVEVFFAYPGFGTLLYQASVNSDVYLIEACAMVGVLVVTVSQLLGDLLNQALNPRLRAGGRAPPTPSAHLEALP
jgi:peptide/nickel transport system permease protein